MHYPEFTHKTGGKKMLVGKLVVDAASDELDIVGQILWQEDDERVAVAWGDERFSETPYTRIEWIDELRPAR